MNHRALDPALSLRDFTMVIEVAEHESFTAAAESVHMSQSALSRAVNATERRVGTKLFHRTTRSVTPTAEGVEFIRLARELLASRDRVMNEFGLYRDGLRGAVRVAALPSVAALVLPPFVARLRTARPGIAVSVEDTLAHVALQRLLDGDVDFAFTTADWLPDDVDFVPLISDRFHAVFREDHPFADRMSVTWTEFADEPLAVFGHSSSIRARTDAVLAELDLTPSATVEAQNIAVIAGLIAAGLGIAAAPEYVLPLMSFANLTSIPLTSPTINRPLGLVTATGRTVSPAARGFQLLLAEHLETR